MERVLQRERDVNNLCLRHTTPVRALPHVDVQLVGGVKMRPSEGSLVAHWTVHTCSGSSVDVDSVAEHETPVAAAFPVPPAVGETRMITGDIIGVNTDTHTHTQDSVTTVLFLGFTTI